MDHVELVWIFNDAKAGFPSAILTGLDRAERWIGEHGLAGTLTRGSAPPRSSTTAIIPTRLSAPPEAGRLR